MQNKTNTTHPRRELHVAKFTFDGTGRQRGEHEKRIVSNRYTMGPIESTPPLQARPVVT